MDWKRRRFLFDSAAGLWLATKAQGFQQPEALRIKIVDAATKKPLAARIRLVDARGAEVTPVGRSGEPAKDAVEGDVRFQSRGYYYTDGVLMVRPGAFPLRYTVVRGYEHEIAEGTLTGASTIELRRWSSVARQRYYSGDVHIHHISPKTCRLEMDAEDLDVAHILTSDFTRDQHEFEGRVNRNSSDGRFIYVSQEFRHDHLGHMCVLDLKKLIQPVKPMQKEHYPLHLTACDTAHAQGGYVTWAHFASWPGYESPLDVAMEKLDGVELLCVLDPRETPLYATQVIQELQANQGLHLWYRYLNCGFRLTASAGTDKMTTFVTVGSNRVYVQVDGEFTYGNWMRGLRRGRTFVTNSPMLEFTVNGRPPGDAIEVSSKNSVVRVQVKAQSQLPYDRLEVVVNGAVVADSSPSGSHHRASINFEHKATDSCWIAARVLEDSSTYRAKQVNFRTIHQPQGTLHGNYYGTRRPETVFAHTSPVYVLRDGRPIRSQEDAEFYVRYLDSVVAWLEREGRFARPSDKTATLDAFRAGQRVYRRRAEEAAQRKTATLPDGRGSLRRSSPSYNNVDMSTATSRRSFLLAAGGGCAAMLAQQQRNNVLFIASDDLNHCLSAYGHAVIQTPNIDRIAQAGVRFDRSYCQFPLCSPSRSSIMTGLAPDTTGVYDLQKHFRESVPDVVTLPQLFQKNGSFAARVGKIYHYGNPGQIGTDGLDDAPSWNGKVNPKGVDKAEEPKLTNYTPDRGLGSALCFYASPAKDEEHTDGMVASETIRLMEENRNRAWFLGAGFYRPHCPYIAPSKYFDRVPLSKVKLAPFEDWEMSIAPQWAYFTRPGNWGLSEKQRLEVMQAYYASILFMDAQVGRLLAALERLKLQDRTTIVFWSDHGYQLGEHGQWMKQTLFEPSARSPLIIAGAGVKARGKGCART
ncbi:MAG: CehA/McbA family metallohydrolase, partial [Bryobacteraceae bacterium]